MATVFTKIINGDIPAYKLAESEDFLAFLDINPVAEGHALVIPKKEVDYIFDVADDLLGDMMRFAKKVAKAIEPAVTCKRIGVAVVGLEVPHAHIHLIPINSVHDMDFRNKLTLSKERLEEIQGKIRANIKQSYPDLLQ